MRKLLLSLTTLALVGISASVLAAQITIRETPVMIKKEGDVFMVPNGTTGSYYYYTTDDSTQYVCTTTSPNELTGVKFLPLNVTVGTEVREVRCYPSSSFIIEAR